MSINDNHNLLRNSILDLIELHQDKPIPEIVVALISVAVDLAKDTAPNKQAANDLIKFALNEEKL